MSNAHGTARPTAAGSSVELSPSEASMGGKVPNDACCANSLKRSLKTSLLDFRVGSLLVPRPESSNPRPLVDTWSALNRHLVDN